jgi:hypothetical protein
MTPSVAAASPTIAPAAPFAVVSSAVHDREWWAEETVRAGTDWPGVVDGAFTMLIAAGLIKQPAAGTTTAWDAPSWRQAAADYHRNRSGRLAVEIEPRRVERLRRLLTVDVSLERAWHKLRDNRQGRFSNNGIFR